MVPIQLFINKAVFARRRTSLGYRLPFALVGIAAMLLLSAFAYHATSQNALQAAKQEAGSLSKWSQPDVATDASVSRASTDLKAFRSSHLLSILENGASATAIKLDEISFAIDDAPNQPYARYRASFTVLSRYPTIRKFLSEIVAGSEGVVLDTVACRREDVNAADVRCDISAYVAYLEKAGG